MKKILAITLVVVLALAFSGVALAGITNTNGDAYGEPGKHIFEATGQVIGITITYDIDTLDSGVGGGVIWYGEMLDDKDTWWAAAGGAWTEWGDANAGKPIVTDGETLTVMFGETIEADGPIVMIEQWWGDDITITGHSFLRPGGAPATGALTFIGIAGVALVASGAGAILVSRKLKKK